ncbi:MAG: ornithine cyclodeaminase family protein [Halobacteriaceae archaeon]
METRLLDRAAVDEHAAVADVVDAVAAAFAADARGDAVMPPKSYVDLPAYGGDFRAMPAYVDVGDWDAAGVKWVNVHPANPAESGLPTVMATMIYSDPATGFPLAIMDGTLLTMRRTGAAAAVATDHLAVADADSLGLVGAGAQAHAQLGAIATVRNLREVVVADADDERARSFAAEYGGDLDVRVGTVSEAGHCDVLSTVTPVRSPVVGPADVGEHTHVNAMGADAPGKHELADEVLRAAKLVIDDYEQCTHSGEINVPWSEGVLDDDDLYATLGEVVVGAVPGREPGDGVTVFDSTGLAIQDLAAAHVVYDRAGAAGTPVDLLGV